MTLGKPIISIAVFIGILLFNKTNPKVLKVILLGFVLSFISSVFNKDFIIDVSFLTFGFLTLSFLIYVVYNKQWLPSIIVVFPLLSFIFKSQFWPYASEIQALMVVPIIAYVIALNNLKGYKNQISILTILVAYSISEVIRFVNYLISVN
ncbi:hypothetical protein [Psychroserpens luteolus]|uniref:hypothetical protein n=1 Tax=Psychroserpens luteolus TaxID=2855840 RepID=UPI001E337485|nr:hypothetical protein [Psychroserpens luteolus]MCD2260995.1 hypothetical protein [Psychroserpens luteolus]